MLSKQLLSVLSECGCCCIFDIWCYLNNCCLCCGSVNVAHCYTFYSVHFRCSSSVHAVKKTNKQKQNKTNKNKTKQTNKQKTSWYTFFDTEHFCVLWVWIQIYDWYNYLLKTCENWNKMKSRFRQDALGKPSRLKSQFKIVLSTGDTYFTCTRVLWVLYILQSRAVRALSLNPPFFSMKGRGGEGSHSD